MATTPTTAVAVVAASFQFTRFEVQRCIRVVSCNRPGNTPS